MEKPEGFVSLAEIVRPQPACGEAADVSVALAAPSEVREADVECAELFREIKLFRVRLVEAFENALDALVRELAVAVVARELALAPVDVNALAKRVLDECADLHPVTIRVSPSDAPRAGSLGLPLEIDARLRSGDLRVDVRDGTLDASLGLRLEAVLRARAVCPG